MTARSGGGSGSTSDARVERLSSEVIRLSHDLRSPLSAIRGFADVMIKRGAELPAEAREDYLARIVANAAALDALIAELYRAAKAAEG